jgi:hypothetical protein
VQLQVDAQERLAGHVSVVLAQFAVGVHAPIGDALLRELIVVAVQPVFLVLVDAADHLDAHGVDFQTKGLIAVVAEALSVWAHQESAALVDAVYLADPTVGVQM